MRGGKVGYDKSSLRANAKQSSETVITRSDKRRSNRIHIENNEIATFRCTPLAMTENCHPELDSGSINADLNVAEMEPSPAFVTFAPAHEQLLPLTKREGNSFTDKVYSLFTTHHSLKASAFTLAEVLVTLGIIGVVSAMTVPTLMQNYQRQSYVTQLHKVYNEFSQASLRYLTDRNALNLSEAGLTDINAIDNFMKTYFKIAKDCGDDINACFPNDYKKVDGTSISPVLASSKGKNYILANGAAIYIFKNGYGVQIHVDVNGKKGPNIVGRDIFAMALYNNGLLDDGCGTAPCTTEKREELFNSYCIKSSGDTWWGCFGKILNDNWQMTY